MSGTWGNNIKYSIFGESHGKGIGIVIDGLPSGLELDLGRIQFEMARRAPGKTNLSTPRKEKDDFEIISGYFNGHTTGSPLCAVICNTNPHSKDYEKMKNIIRPGHADYTANIKYSGYSDYRGGGHFSGRLTAPIVFAGAIAKQILSNKAITIGSHIYRIGSVSDTPFDKVYLDPDKLLELQKSRFPVNDSHKGIEMKELILKSRKELDSIGGVIEAAAAGLPSGFGSPFFDSIESTLSHLLFSIPGIKGVEFGSGFDMACMRGSEANDGFYTESGSIRTYTNNNGGVLGGITNGMPLIFRAAFKPTPSIGKPQKTIDISSMENMEIEVKGRHDPCIVPRAVPVVEAVCAMALLEHLYGR